MGLSLLGVGVYFSSPFERLNNNSLIRCPPGMVCHYYCESGSLVDDNSQWYFNNIPLSTNINVGTYQISRNFAADGEGVVLVFDPNQSPNEGIYQCDINDVDDDARSLFINVFVNPSKEYLLHCIASNCPQDIFFVLGHAGPSCSIIIYLLAVCLSNQLHLFQV